MRAPRPQSYDIGPFTVRRDAASPFWRVFRMHREQFSSVSKDAALVYAQDHCSDEFGICGTCGREFGTGIRPGHPNGCRDDHCPASWSA